MAHPHAADELDSLEIQMVTITILNEQKGRQQARERSLDWELNGV
jgi:hypothetical protein